MTLIEALKRPSPLSPLGGHDQSTTDDPGPSHNGTLDRKVSSFYVPCLTCMLQLSLESAVMLDPHVLQCFSCLLCAMLLTALSRFGHFPLKDFFFLQVMPMALFPESTGFVEDCQTSVGIRMDVIITHHQLFELVIHVNGKILSNKQKEAAFCGLLSRMLKDVPTEEAPMRVLWAKVLRMLEAYRKSVKTEQKHGEFDRLWSPQSNPDLRKKLEAPFQINPPQVLDN